MIRMLILFQIIASQLVAQSDTIPFVLNSQHNICVKTRINQSEELTLMFHSSTTDVTLTKEAVAGKSFLKSAQSTTVQTWGGKEDSEYSDGNSLYISGLHFDSVAVFINENSGEGTDGKFGFNFFEDKILEIDYDHQRMVVHSKLPKLSKGFKKIPLIIKDGSAFIPGELKIGKAVYRDSFMFHTGFGGSVLLDPAIGEKYGMQAKLSTIKTSELQDAYGNIFKIETKQLPSMKVGSKKLKKVPLSFAARSSDIPMKVFGNGLLRRFNVIFDYQKNLVYLKPNNNWKAQF